MSTGLRAAMLGTALLLPISWGLPSAAKQSRPVAPATMRASVVIEPPSFEIGETAHVELAVVTPPGHRVAPVPPPEGLDGVWVLASETPRVEQESSRWVHRMRYQVRARATGQFAWPPQAVAVTTPAGETTSVETAVRPFHVVEVSSEHPEQRGFFSYRAPAPTQPGRGVWLPALSGAFAALAGVALVGLARRLRSGDAATPAVVSPLAAAWRSSQATLAAARELAGAERVRAADMASSALRVYGSARFGLPMLARTTEELAAGPAPRGAKQRWTDWLEVLHELDQVRFLPAPAAGSAAHADEGVARLLERARALVGEGAPGARPS